MGIAVRFSQMDKPARGLKGTLAPSGNPALGSAGRVGHMHPRCLGGTARAQCDACVRSRVPHMFYSCSTHVPHMCQCILYHVPFLSRLIGGTPTPIKSPTSKNCGTCYELQWTMCGTCVEHVWNMGGT